MLKLHPQKPPPTLPAQPPPASLIFSTDQVVSALLSFNEGTAPGPSSLKADYLKDANSAWNTTRRKKFIVTLTRVVNLLARGKVPLLVQPYICGATLHAGLKPKGGYCPIAIGEVLSRLTSKCFSFALASESASFLSPLQLGVKVRNGCEAVIHSFSTIMHSTSVPLEDRCILQIDLQNAFNVIDRSLFLEQTCEHFPSLSAWAEYSYCSPSHLFYHGKTILNSVGARQGNSDASLLFALGLQPTVKKIQSEVPSLIANLWIMDDGTVAGPLVVCAR
jgi:hypothetical protein